MPVVFPNVLIWTARPAYSASTGTSAPVAYLAEVEAHAGPISQSEYRSLPEAALESSYLVKVDIGTDITVGDMISQVTLPDDPVFTPWDQLGVNEVLWVVFARNSAAGPLQYRMLYCKRETGGGPSQ